MNKLKRYQLLIDEADKYFNLGNYNSAYNKFEEAFQIQTTVRDALNYALCAFYLDKYDQAEKIYLYTIEEFPNVPTSYIGYSYLLYKTQKYGDAIKYLNKCIPLLNKDKENEVQLLSLAYGDIGSCYYELNEYDEAITNLEKSIELMPNLRSYYLLIDIYEVKQEYEKSLDRALKMYEIDPNHGFANYLLGNAYRGVNDWVNAKKYFELELKQKEPYAYTYFYMSLIHLNEKDYDKALMYSLKALEQLKDDPNVWYNLGCVYALKEDYKNAYECLKASCILNKENIEYMKNDPELEAFRNTKEYEQILTQ